MGMNDIALEILRREEYSGEYILFLVEDYWVVLTKEGRAFEFTDNKEKLEYKEVKFTSQYSDWYYERWSEEGDEH